MTKDKTIHFRVSDEERDMLRDVAQKLGRNESEAMRLIVREFAGALGVVKNADTKALIRIRVETVGELPY